MGGDDEEKDPGIIWNASFASMLNELGFNQPEVLGDNIDTEDESGNGIEPEDENDDNNTIEVENCNELLNLHFNNIYKKIISEETKINKKDEAAKRLNEDRIIEDFKIRFIIHIQKCKYTEKLKKNKNAPKNLYNTDYVTSLNGIIKIKFLLGNKDTKAEDVAEFSYYPKRTDNMEPEEHSIFSTILSKAGAALKALDSDAVPQNGLGMLASKSIAAIKKRTGRNVIQDEDFNIDFINSDFDRSNISYGNKRSDVIRNSKQKISPEATKSLQDELQEIVSLIAPGFTINVSSMNNKQILFNLFYNDEFVVTLGCRNE